MKKLRLLASGTAVLLLVSGCASGPKHEPPPPAPTPVVEEPRSYTIPGVNFEFDSAKLTPAGQAAVAEAAEGIKASQGASFNVIGHTDSKGSNAYNQRLSERRANSVAKALVQNGVSSGQLMTSGMGETQPIADNRTAEGRAANRRVEIIQAQ